MTVGPAAGCRRCGESFDLVAVVDPAHAGRCPSCGVALAPGYGAVLVSAVHELLEAHQRATRAERQLAEIAPDLRLGAPTSRDAGDVGARDAAASGVGTDAAGTDAADATDADTAEADTAGAEVPR